VQDQLGNSTITLTTDTYTSVLPETARAAAENTAHHHVNPPVPAAGNSMDITEVMALPAVTDLITARKPLGWTDQELRAGMGGQVPVPGHRGRENLPRAHRRPARPAVRAPAFLNSAQTAAATLPREKAGHHPESYFRPTGSA